MAIGLLTPLTSKPAGADGLAKAPKASERMIRQYPSLKFIITSRFSVNLWEPIGKSGKNGFPRKSSAVIPEISR
jgi:hypothetical protein